MGTLRGIPPVSDYAHWNEEAEAVWYAENRYDMEHADEIDDDGPPYWADEDDEEDEDDPHYGHEHATLDIIGDREGIA